MNNNPLISIIIPVYNVEKYIDNCVESVLNQTYINFELIILNDGSKDSSYLHLQKYSNKPKITIVNKENSGQSDTRYQGLLLSKGDYILFVDSDDTIEPNTLETFISNSLEGEADAIFARYRLVDEAGKVIRKQPKYSIQSLDSKESIIKDALRIKNFKSSLVLKMVKREILISAFNDDVRNTRINEDVLLSIRLAMNCQRVTFTKNIIYNVLQRSDSLTRNIKPEIISVHNSIFTYIKMYLDTNNLFDQFKSDYYYGYSKSILYALAVCAQKSINYENFYLLTDHFKEEMVLGNKQYEGCKKEYPFAYKTMRFFISHRRLFYYLNYAFKSILKY